MMKYKLIYCILSVFLCITYISAQENDDPLLNAYKKEFVFLDTEIRLLQERIEEVEKDGIARVEASENELSRLEETLIKLDLTVEKKTEDLRRLEEQNTNAEEASDTLHAVLEQANSRLAKSSIKPYEQANEDEGTELINEIRYIFDQSLSILQESGSFRIEDGMFFLSNGKKTDGVIVRIGEIASFGSDGTGRGTLVPAGNGNLRLDRKDNSAKVKMLFSGEQPKTLSFFLYESLDNLVETSKKKTITDTIKGGGFIGIIIILLGFAAMILIVFRIILLRKSGDGVARNIEDLAALIDKREWASALSLSASIPGSLGRVLIATIEGLKTEPKKADDAIAECIMNEQPRLDRFRIPLSVFAAVAPLLGLLGTVTGMIATFDIITIYGTGDPKLLSGGISEALITTQLGLMVAIPTLLIGNLLSSWANSITSTLEVKALRLVNAFSGNDKNKVIS